MLLDVIPTGDPTPYASVVITAGQQGTPTPPAPEPLASGTVFTVTEK